MKNTGQEGKERTSIKFKAKKFKKCPQDEELYELNESMRRKENQRLLRESTLDVNGFSEDVMECFPDKAMELLTLARRSYDDKESVLNEISSLIGGKAVSFVKGKNHWQDDWQDSVCAFIDMGDDNGKTIVYDTISEEFNVMSVNDFILLKDQEYRII